MLTTNNLIQQISHFQHLSAWLPCWSLAEHRKVSIYTAFCRCTWHHFAFIALVTSINWYLQHTSFHLRQSSRHLGSRWYAFWTHSLLPFPAHEPVASAWSCKTRVGKGAGDEWSGKKSASFDRLVQKHPKSCENPGQNEISPFCQV